MTLLIHTTYSIHFLCKKIYSQDVAWATRGNRRLFSEQKWKKTSACLVYSSPFATETQQYDKPMIFSIQKKEG